MSERMYEIACVEWVKEKTRWKPNKQDCMGSFVGIWV
jgi:hypothetical protein